MGQSAAIDRASKPPSRNRCLLLALADVELRCCMQWLPLHDALHFARCNQRTMAVAENPQGWASSMLRFEFSRPPPHSLDRDRLLRHVWTAVRWPGTIGRLDSESFERLIVREWDLSASELSVFQWTRILLDPRVQHLTALHMHWRLRLFIDSSVLRLVTKLPQLHTLSVAPIDGAVDCWSMLADAPSLTSLSIQDLRADADRSVLPHVASCVHLTSLHLLNLCLYGGAFLAFFSLPKLRRLRHLELESFSFLRTAGQAAEDQMSSVRMAFTSLQCLESLTLCEVPLSEWIAPALAEVATLRIVVIQPIARNTNSHLALETMPSLMSLMHLLECASQLQRVVLRLTVAPPVNEALVLYNEYRRFHGLQPGASKAKAVAGSSILERPNCPSDRFWLEWIGR